MPLQGEYAPSPVKWARDQVEEIESSGGTNGMSMHGMPVIVLTSQGVRSGSLRKNPLMRVEHDGRYAAVGSMGGQPTHPHWVHNLRANPHVEVQDGPVKRDMHARELTGEERDEWWARAVETFPNYATYQDRTERVIPVFLLEPIDP